MHGNKGGGGSRQCASSDNSYKLLENWKCPSVILDLSVKEPRLCPAPPILSRTLHISIRKCQPMYISGRRAGSREAGRQAARRLGIILYLEKSCETTRPAAQAVTGHKRLRNGSFFNLPKLPFFVRYVYISLSARTTCEKSSCAKSND
jgi:hypothetical protein